MSSAVTDRARPGQLPDLVPSRHWASPEHLVTAAMSAVVGLTFLFGFGNVWHLALTLGVPGYVAPLIAPAVDLSVLGLMVGSRYLAMHGAPDTALRPARLLLLGTSGASLALNVASPVTAGRWGSAAFDAVGPLLLIGWSEVGPKLLRAMADMSASSTTGSTVCTKSAGVTAELGTGGPDCDGATSHPQSPTADALLQRARDADALHREQYLRPISAERLRKTLRISAERSRALVRTVRQDPNAIERRSLTAS